MVVCSCTIFVLFVLKEKGENEGKDIKITMSYVEVYNENILDLLVEKANHYLSEELRGETMTIAQQLLDQGMKQGMKQGVQQGMQQGRQQRNEEIALILLAEGMSIEKVAKLAELPEKYLQKLKRAVVT